MLEDIFDDINLCKELTEHQKSKAIYNLIEIRYSPELRFKTQFNMDNACDKEKSDLFSLMSWAETPQGFYYWSSIYDKLWLNNKRKKVLKINPKLKKLQEIEEME